MKCLALFAVVLALAISGCRHRYALRIGDMVTPPHGLDSLATVEWIARQRAACPGNLVIAVDHMQVGSLDGSPVPYESEIVSVFCEPPRP
jgi:hypothetical protein